MCYKFILGSFIIIFVIVVWGIVIKGWYLYELGGVFIVWGVVVVILGKFFVDEVVNKFIEGVFDFVIIVVLIGVVCGIVLILEDG